MDKKLAYLILAHDDPKHLKRLVNSINYKCDIYIHVDLKADIELFKKEVGNLQNVHFIDKRYKVNWSGFNMVNATKELIINALYKEQEYLHLILLSGMDYPIKPCKYIYEYFYNNNKVEFIRGFSITNQGESQDIKKIKKYWFWDFNISKNLIINKIVKKLLYYIFILKNKEIYFIDNKCAKSDVCYGSQWWGITPNCAKYIIDYIENNKNLDKYFKYSFAPDEMYFHTIIFNSHYKNNTLMKGIEDNYGYWNWSNFHHIDPSLAKYFNEYDIKELDNSDKLFVRKVNSKHSSKLLDYIDRNILID